MKVARTAAGPTLEILVDLATRFYVAGQSQVEIARALGLDASTRYGLHVPGTKSLTQSELASSNPYNTRNPNVIGLPPTPIANPGLASMQAAAHPAPGNWLYFVRKPDKVHHYFTASFQDFQNHEIQYGFGK